MCGVERRPPGKRKNSAHGLATGRLAAVSQARPKVAHAPYPISLCLDTIRNLAWLPFASRSGAMTSQYQGAARHDEAPARRGAKGLTMAAAAVNDTDFDDGFLITDREESCDGNPYSRP